MDKPVFISKFNSTMQELLGLLNTVTQDKINQIPFEGSWTVGQVGDHLLKSYGLFETLRGNVEPTTRPVNEKFPIIENVFLNFETKLKSPDFILPTTDPIDKEVLVESISHRVEEIILYMKENDLSPTCLDFELPDSGPFTRLEWLQLMYCHTQRHNRQLRKILEKLSYSVL